MAERAPILPGLFPTGPALAPYPPVARARNADPWTSHAAAREVEQQGAAQNQRAKCLDAVRSHPGRTSFECAVFAGLDRYQAARRLPELEADGLVMKGEPIKVRGRWMVTWWPVVKAEPDGALS
jgi:predicted HTH transcriptional regulator